MHARACGPGCCASSASLHVAAKWHRCRGGRAETAISTTICVLPGVYGDKVYLVTELLDGGELLDTVITRGSYTERDARAIFKSVRFSGVCAPPTTARCPVRQSDATESVCSALMLQLARVVGVMAAC